MSPGATLSMQPTIFIAIASYNDPELPRTLLDAISMAANPEALRFGICWQADESIPIPLEDFRSDERFRFHDTTVEASEGGTWARSISQALWDGEDYTLQIDSHMKFEPRWDERLIAMMAELPSEKPLITVNAPLFHYDEDGRLHRRFDMGVPTSRIRHWGGDDSPLAPWVDFGPPNTEAWARNRFITGNFLFTLGKWCEEVPQDPEHYYWGEELNLTMRSFSWGYDLFLPTEIVVWHLYHRKGAPRRHWEKGSDVVKAKNAVAMERLRILLYDEDRHEELGRYGFGPHRGRRDYEIFAGMDFDRRLAHPDTYTGRPPSPVTIHGDADWQRCISFEEARRSLGVA